MTPSLHLIAILQGIVRDGILAMGLALGQDLKLFDALVEVSSEENPATAKQVAEKAAMKERYIKEWLCFMACNDIIEVDEEGERFWVKKERIPEITGANMNQMFVFQQHLPMIGKVYPALAEVMRISGPLGLDNDMFDDFHLRMASFSEARHKRYLISDYLPLTGMREKLEKGGIEVLDVGCGRGVHAAEFAKHFPKSFFTGIDISLDAIVGANKRRDEANEGLENLSFLQMNAQDLKDSWSDKFDWVTMFDACHDQTRPDLSLKEIYRVLKPGGLFSMVEVDGTGNVYKDKQNDYSKFIYGISLFHCLPVGSDSEEALSLGAAWGRERAQKLLRDAGFTKIDIVPTPFFRSNILYMCYKEPKE
ncbi:unnamed protein product [Toxocara canis]|uniref:3-demethylubiquinone-9 3-methyltransferase n=1 Tax=Toxocara canis TaxID=6265 RepID=A0A183VBH2_TOXCA|nr:unnamed protein product [Toxocara canis]